MDLFDIYQNGRINQAHKAVSRVADEQATERQVARDRSADLNLRIDRLTLLCETMWSLVTEVTGLTDEHLEARLTEFDTMDGTADDRRTPEPTTCRCGAKVHARAKVCYFCGDEAPSRSAFHRI